MATIQVEDRDGARVVGVVRELVERAVRIRADDQEHRPAEAPRHVLGAQNPYAAARSRFPTSRDFLIYLMTAHLAYHLGQLAAWRAAAGLGRLTRTDQQIA